MRKLSLGAAAAAVAVLAVGFAAGGASSALRTQPDSQFGASFAASSVSAVDATTQKVSCYRPEVAYFDGLSPAEGYPAGGGTLCRSSVTTGEFQGPYDTQDQAGAANEPMLVKDHSESDIRVDPSEPSHLIGQSKWIVNAEGYNHLLGFYESFDGGMTWSTQGHVPGYEGWTDNTDPVGAFDPFGNFYSLILPYNFYYSKSGEHLYNNGSNQTNPTVPPEAISVAVHPHGSTGPNDWITKNIHGQPDFIETAKNANTSDPDKQWIAIDTNRSSPCFGTVYSMWTIFVINPSYMYVSTATANPNGTHSDWTTAQVLPTINGKPWDTYLLPHVAPDGTVYTTVTSNPQKKDFSTADIYTISSRDCGKTWLGPYPVVKDVNVPTYQNTTFREGIVNTFAVGKTPTGTRTNTSRSGNAYPLYVSYEDGSSGLSTVYIVASSDGGLTWSAPLRVNDNPESDGPEALQPNLNVAPNGTVGVTFYDRRLPCPDAGPDAQAAGLQFDPAKPSGAKNYCVNTAIQFYDEAR
jgi:hypothetical protein